MIHLKLRQAGERVNHKRVIACMWPSGCRFAGGAARRCHSPTASRLVIPMAPNEIWSADFVFDRTAEGGC